MIRLAARTLVSHCDPRRDFVGHVGGDDFVVLFQSADWLDHCQRILSVFNENARSLFDDDALARGGIEAEDRQGVRRFFKCTTLSIGAVPVRPGLFRRPRGIGLGRGEQPAQGQSVGPRLGHRSGWAASPATPSTRAVA